MPFLSYRISGVSVVINKKCPQLISLSIIFCQSRKNKDKKKFWLYGPLRPTRGTSPLGYRIELYGPSISEESWKGSESLYRPAPPWRTQNCPQMALRLCPLCTLTTIFSPGRSDHATSSTPGFWIGLEIFALKFLHEYIITSILISKDELVGTLFLSHAIPWPEGNISTPVGYDLWSKNIKQQEKTNKYS